MSNTICDELRFQKRIERVIELAEKLFIHTEDLGAREAIMTAENFLTEARNYAIDKRCEFNGVLRDTEDSAS